MCWFLVGLKITHTEECVGSWLDSEITHTEECVGSWLDSMLDSDYSHWGMCWFLVGLRLLTLRNVLVPGWTQCWTQITHTEECVGSWLDSRS